MHLGITEILLLIFLALVLFGGSKLSGVGKALGRSIKDFKTELQGTENKSSDVSGETKA
ncbi:MAG: twin-arginine translocase TatA/TatE family subunit [Fretibacterium sp.]|nr:twin-arginine translocase TatA/TatE family subunit [Fretibacterium sp.]